MIFARYWPGKHHLEGSASGSGFVVVEIKIA
jgi:hypothetical protein